MFPDPKRVTLCLALFISASAMAQSNAPLTGAMNGGARAQARKRASAGGRHAGAPRGAAGPDADAAAPGERARARAAT